MKYIKIIAVFCACLIFQPNISTAQDNPKIDVNAIVVGSNNEPINGAVIKNRADDIVVTTGTKGSFTLKVAQNSLLIVSAPGYKEKEVIANTDLVKVELEPAAEEVQLFFRKADKKDILGGVSVVNVNDEFNKNYTINPIEGLNTLAGGFNGNSIWGRGNLLIVVDGIPRDVNNIKTSEIDQITILKGAGAVALYGTHAVNGVIYITTKRGQVSDQKIDIRVNSGMYVPKRYPDYLNAADYMTYYTEAYINDGLYEKTGFLPFDKKGRNGEIIMSNQEVIDNTASGINPYRYPDIDFYSSEFLKKAYNRSDVNTNVYGGGENAQYFTNIGFSRQGSLLNFGEGKKSSDNRFNLRGNVDIKINRWLKAYVDAGVILSSARGVQTNYWEQSGNIRPTMGSTPYNPFIPISMIDLSNPDNEVLVNNSIKIDDKYILGGTTQNQENPFAEVYLGGYNKNVSRQFMFNTGLDMDLSGITEGLAFRTKIAIDYRTSYSEGYNHTYRVYSPSWASIDGVDLVDTLTAFSTVDMKSNTLYINNSAYQQILYMSGQLDYKRTFNSNHNIFAMLIANGYQYSISGQYQKVNNTNLGSHLGYNFKNKYYLEFNGSLLHTTMVPPANRLNFSPVLSIGWRISEENFMEGMSFIDNLKLNATLGRLYTDSEIEANYLYVSKYQYRGVGFYSWAAGMGRDVTTSKSGGNPDLKVPKRDEISFGLEASMFNRLLEIEGNYFSVKYSDGIVQATDLYPSYMQLPDNGSYDRSFVPYINYDERKRVGYDFNVRLNKELGKVNWILGIAGTYYDTEILKHAVNYEDDYQLRKGTPVDGIWGLKADGFYADDDDIINSPKSVYGQALQDIKPGDIKYIDQNGDNIINDQDQVLLAKGGWYGAPFTLGINISARWKNLTFYAQGVGQWGAYGIKSRLTDWVYGQRKYSDIVVNRWAYYTHPLTGEVVDTRASATYPRLTSQESRNNFQNSDFWLYKTDRFDISKVQVSYNLPEGILRNTFIKDVDIYISAANLITFSPEKKYLETNVGSAPQMRFYNMGISASF